MGGPSSPIGFLARELEVPRHYMRWEGERYKKFLGLLAELCVPHKVIVKAGRGILLSYMSPLSSFHAPFPPNNTPKVVRRGKCVSQN